MMDHSKHQRLTVDEYSPASLTGAVVYGPDDSRIGEVSEVIGQGEAAQVVVDVGGFLGLGAKPVAVQARDLDLMRDENNNVHAVTSWTKEDLKALPEYTR